MSFWERIFGNEVLICAVAGWTVAQVLKTLIDFSLNKSFTPERLVGFWGNAQFPLCHGVRLDNQCRALLWDGIL